MTEAVILPEMLQAGLEAMHESQRRGLDEIDTAISIYLAMSAVFEMSVARDQNQTRH